MLKINKRKYVYTGIGSDEKGFTFISVLLMITIIFMTLPFVSYLTKTISYSSNYDAMSVQQFFYFLRDDVITATDIIISEPEKVHLYHYNGTVITFEKYQDQIRRQIDGTGHEVYLRDIKEVRFTSNPFGVHASITTKQGEQFEKIIILYQ